jgi:acetyl esterase/lipase
MTQLLSDIEFHRVGEKVLRLDLYLPVGEGIRPLVIWIHGGAWREGDNKQLPAVPLLTDAGFAVASITYRFSQEALFPAQLEDCVTAVRWLHTHAPEHHINPDKIGVWGASAGGHLAALLGLTRDVAVQAVCDWYGPTDFLQMDSHAPKYSAFLHDAADSPESQLVGGPIQEHPDRVAQANPIHYITSGQSIPPFLIMHGDHDPLVPFHQSQLLFEALSAAGAEVVFEPVTGAGHGGKGFRTAVAQRQVLHFFQKHLG